MIPGPFLIVLHLDNFLELKVRIKLGWSVVEMTFAIR